MSSYVTRFAPSPTGYLHLGHAYSALQVWQIAGQNPEKFHLRIDDLDHTRCKAEFEAAILDDLDFLGICWKNPMIRQSQRLHRYRKALDFLINEGFAYACFLSRRARAENLSAPHHPAEFSPSSRHLLTDDERSARLQSGETAVWRVDVQRILAQTGKLYWQDLTGTQHLANETHCGDVIIGRRDIPYSYHLSVVLDDADSEIECVARGEDLLPSTPIHVILQAALGLPTPLYYHHKLVQDETGKRLAKRHDALSLQKMRSDGLDRASILAQIDNLHA